MPTDEFARVTVPGMKIIPAANGPAPQVSVVIPTRERGALAERAVRSVLAQSFNEFEIVVVIDGPDPKTKEALQQLGDKRLRIVHLTEKVGGSEARNIGVRFARGKWIALLDDDDEWLPEKLAKQWSMGESLAGRYVLVASRFIERTEDEDRELPRRMPALGERFSDYMFARRGWHSGEGFLQTSTWFVSRALMIKVPFTRGLRRCQDLDWLLHATALPEIEVRILPDVLAVFHHDDRRGRVSRTSDWRFLYAWAMANRGYFTPRAFSFFVATFCVPSAAKEREAAGTFLFLLRSCRQHGDVNGKCLLLFLLCWLMPEARRRGLRARLGALRNAVTRKHATITGHALPGKATS
jgi:glycosyltransferase involved in cell wall biosynthesis